MHTRVAVKLKRKSNEKMQAAFFFFLLSASPSASRTQPKLHILSNGSSLKPPFFFPPWREHIIIFVVFAFLSLNAELSVFCCVFFFLLLMLPPPPQKSSSVGLLLLTPPFLFLESLSSSVAADAFFLHSPTHPLLSRLPLVLLLSVFFFFVVVVVVVQGFFWPSPRSIAHACVCVSVLST